MKKTTVEIASIAVGDISDIRNTVVVNSEMGHKGVDLDLLSNCAQKHTLNMIELKLLTKKLEIKASTSRQNSSLEEMTL